MIKILIALLIIACIASLFIKGPDGEPLMTLDDWKIEMPSSLNDLLSGAEPAPIDEAPVSTPTTVYKWQDEEGQWHFSSAPPDMESAEEMVLTGDINLMDAYVPPEEPEEAAPSMLTGIPSGPMTVSPEQVKEMMETVTNLQETIDQRKADIDAIVAPAIND